MSASGTGSFQWFLEGVALSQATNQTFPATQTGNYSVMITDANGCTGKSSVFNVSNLGINSNSYNKEITIYPNPTKGLITVSLVENTPVDKIEIVDILGKIVSVKTENTSQIDISEMANGIYLFKLYSGENVSINKIIKK